MSKGRRMPMGMPGGGNMNNMMKQVQKMQQQMEVNLSGYQYQIQY